MGIIGCNFFVHQFAGGLGLAYSCKYAMVFVDFPKVNIHRHGWRWDLSFGRQIPCQLHHRPTYLWWRCSEFLLYLFIKNDYMLKSANLIMELHFINLIRVTIFVCFDFSGSNNVNDKVVMSISLVNFGYVSVVGVVNFTLSIS